MNKKTHTKTLSHRIPKQNTTHNPNKNILKPTLRGERRVRKWRQRGCFNNTGYFPVPFLGFLLG
jgi:hypothetical protein